MYDGTIGRPRLPDDAQLAERRLLLLHRGRGEHLPARRQRHPEGGRVGRQGLRYLYGARECDHHVRCAQPVHAGDPGVASDDWKHAAMVRNTRKLVAIAATVAAVSLLATACSSGGSDPAPTGAVPSASGSDRAVRHGCPVVPRRHARRGRRGRRLAVGPVRRAAPVGQRHRLVADRARARRLQVGQPRGRPRERPVQGHDGHPHGPRHDPRVERQEDQPRRLPAARCRQRAQGPRRVGRLGHRGRHPLQGPHLRVPDLERGQPQELLERHSRGDGRPHEAGLRHHQGDRPRGPRRLGVAVDPADRPVRQVLPGLPRRARGQGLADRRGRHPHLPDRRRRPGRARAGHQGRPGRT